MIERSEIQWGMTPIPYVIRRTGREKTVALTIEGPGELIVTAPAGVPVEKLNGIVRRKAPWVVRRIRRVSDLPPPPSEREFVSGETFRYLGRQHGLRLDPARDGVVLLRGYLVVGVSGQAGGDRAGNVRQALVGWYRQRAAERLPEVVATWARKLGARVTDASVRDQRSRWGSCDAKGVLRLNWRIIQAPRICIEYVAAHEVTHVEHASHGTAFWATLGRVMPDYERRRARLPLSPRARCTSPPMRCTCCAAPGRVGL